MRIWRDVGAAVRDAMRGQLTEDIGKVMWWGRLVAHGWIPDDATRHVEWAARKGYL